MITLAYAFAPAAMVSLFAAAVPVLAGIRQRHGRLAEAMSATEAALEITGTPSDREDALVVGVINRTAEVRTLHLSVSLYGEEGAECARFELPSRRLLPGRTAHEHLDLHSLGDGTYRAVVVAEFGGEWFGAQYDWARAPQPTRLVSAA